MSFWHCHCPNSSYLLILFSLLLKMHYPLISLKPLLFAVGWRGTILRLEYSWRLEIPGYSKNWPYSLLPWEWNGGMLWERVLLTVESFAECWAEKVEHWQQGSEARAKYFLGRNYLMGQHHQGFLGLRDTKRIAREWTSESAKSATNIAEILFLTH